MAPAEGPGAGCSLDRGKVSVWTLGGEEHDFELSLPAKVSDLRKQIDSSRLCPWHCQQLYLGGHLLRDVEEIPNEATINIVQRHPIGVAEVHVWTGDVVDHINIVYRDGKTDCCGEPGGWQQPPFILEPDEHLTEVHFREGFYYGSGVILALKLVASSGRTSILYGHDGDDDTWTHAICENGEQIKGWSMKRDLRGFVGAITDINFV